MRKPFIERLIEALIRASGAITTLVVLLIVFYLFKEGFGLFSKPEIEDGYIALVSPENPVDRLTAQDIRKIYAGDDDDPKKTKITNWKAFGGPDQPILAATIDNLEKILPDGDSVRLTSDERVTMLMRDSAHVLAILPARFASFGKVIPLRNMSFTDFLFGDYWYPTSNPAPRFGVWPIVVATLMVTFFAILIALPTGLIVAIFMTEIGGERVRSVLKPLIELLAGVPSVVYGFFGLVVVVPLIQQAFDLSSGATALAGAIMLGIISLPAIITLSDDALRSVPREMREASLALGASHMQTTFRVVVPYALSGITSAAILGVGRAVGETMAVLMVTGNSAQMPGGLLDSVRTITATIALELGESPKGGNHYQALFVLGCVVFMITLVMNMVAGYIASKKQVL